MKALQFVTIVLFVVCLLPTAQAQGQAASPADQETAVRGVIQHELEGWSKFDAAQVASCYTADTTWQNPFEVRLHSRADLQKFLTNLFQRPGYRSAKDTMAPHITDIQSSRPAARPSGVRKKAQARSTTQQANPWPRATPITSRS